MSISDIDTGKCTLKKTGFVYIFITMFVALFGAVYERFSHEVFSYYMLYAFAFPLTGGVLPSFCLFCSHLKPPNRVSFNLYHSGIAALTTGSICKGILEIYGTTNHLVTVYWIVGVLLILSGLICYFAGRGNDNTVTAKYKKGGI